jgi:hypothetical protein
MPKVLKMKCATPPNFIKELLPVNKKCKAFFKKIKSFAQPPTACSDFMERLQPLRGVANLETFNLELKTYICHFYTPYSLGITIDIVPVNK